MDFFPDDFLAFIDESHATVAASPRHVRRRSFAEDDAGRTRIPPADRRSITGR